MRKKEVKCYTRCYMGLRSCSWFDRGRCYSVCWWTNTNVCCELYEHVKNRTKQDRTVVMVWIIPSISSIPNHLIPVNCTTLRKKLLLKVTITRTLYDSQRLSVVPLLCLLWNAFIQMNYPALFCAGDKSSILFIYSAFLTRYCSKTYVIIWLYVLLYIMNYSQMLMILEIWIQFYYYTSCHQEYNWSTTNMSHIVEI